MTVKNAKPLRCSPNVQERILPASAVWTDEWVGYRHLKVSGDDICAFLMHGAWYVTGEFTTNTIEEFWSLTKREIYGLFHSVSNKHLQGYLNEYAWRHNHRNEPGAHFQQLFLPTALPR